MGKGKSGLSGGENGSAGVKTTLSEEERAMQVLLDAEKKYGGSTETPYDEWGDMYLSDHVDLSYVDEDGHTVHFGWIEDNYNYIQEEEILPTTKKECLSTIDSYRNDDGTYGGEDEHFGIAYTDGNYIDLSELDGKAYSRRGIVGVHIATADYEMVWGGERNRRTGKIDEYETWTADGSKGHTNSYSGYKAVGKQRVRTISYARKAVGEKGYGNRYKTIKKSTVVDLKR